MSYTRNFHFKIIRLFHVIQFFNCQVVLIHTDTRRFSQKYRRFMTTAEEGIGRF